MSTNPAAGLDIFQIFDLADAALTNGGPDARTHAATLLTMAGITNADEVAALADSYGTSTEDIYYGRVV